MFKKALVGALEVLQKPLVTLGNPFVKRWESVGEVLEFTRLTEKR